MNLYPVKISLLANLFRTCLTVIVLSIGTKTAPAQTVTDFKSILPIEQQFRENALKAENQYVGKSISLDMYVNSVEKKNGKTVITTSIVFFENNVEAYVIANLKDGQVQLASNLKPKDLIRITGILSSRQMQSRERMQVDTVGDKVYGGTVTDQWPVYTVNSAQVKVIETLVARNDKARKLEENKKALQDRFVKALADEDQKAANKVVEEGLEPAYLNSIVDEIADLDPKVESYDKAIRLFKITMATGKANIGRAISYSVGVDPGRGFFPGRSIRMKRRPEMLKVLVDLKMINYKGKFPSGDNLLLYLIKDPIFTTFEYSDSVGSVNVNPDDIKLIKIIADSPEAAGCADQPDKYGKTAKEYLAKEQDENLFQDRAKIFNEMRRLVLGIPKGS